MHFCSCARLRVVHVCVLSVGMCLCVCARACVCVLCGSRLGVRYQSNSTIIGLADAHGVDILGFVAAGPDGSRSYPEIAVEAELGVINAAIAASERVVRFEAWFATPDQVALCAAKRPKVLHFSGHGSPAGFASRTRAASASRLSM